MKPLLCNHPAPLSPEVLFGPLDGMKFGKGHMQSVCREKGPGRPSNLAEIAGGRNPRTAASEKGSSHPSDR